MVHNVLKHPNFCTTTLTMKCTAFPSSIIPGSEWISHLRYFQQSLVSSCSTFPVSSPCRGGFCSSFFFFFCCTEKTTLTTASWDSANNCLVALAALCSSCPLHWNGRATPSGLWSREGIHREDACNSIAIIVHDEDVLVVLNAIWPWWRTAALVIFHRQ